MNRRKFFTLFTGAAVARSTLARAQQAQKVPLVGFLHPGFPDSGSPVFDALGQGLRDAGYVEGETIKIEARWARGKPDILPQLTRELIELRADVLVPTGRPSIEAARAATTERQLLQTTSKAIPSPAAMCKAWLTREATSPASFWMRQRYAANGCNK
jgi:putative ABC transport system substrate-binding protein